MPLGIDFALGQGTRQRFPPTPTVISQLDPAETLVVQS